jgi:hypothetical protein
MLVNDVTNLQLWLSLQHLHLILFDLQVKLLIDGQNIANTKGKLIGHEKVRSTKIRIVNPHRTVHFEERNVSRCHKLT